VYFYFQSAVASAPELWCWGAIGLVSFSDLITILRDLNMSYCTRDVGEKMRFEQLFERADVGGSLETDVGEM